MSVCRSLRSKGMKDEPKVLKKCLTIVRLCVKIASMEFADSKIAKNLEVAMKDMLLRRLSQVNYNVNLAVDEWSKKSREFENGLDEKPFLDAIAVARSERDAFIFSVGEAEYQTLRDELSRKYHKTARVRSRLRKFFASGEEVYFLTFTFTDSVLESTSADTRKQYVRKWLSSHCLDYVANVDFGKKNNREHYHAVALCSSRPDMSDWLSRCGGFKCRRVSKDNPVYVKRVPQYINKLSNHSTKNFSKSNLIWGRPYQKSTSSYNPYSDSSSLSEFDELPF